MSATTAVAVAAPAFSTYRRLWRAVLRLKLALLDRRAYNRVALEQINGLPFVVLPDVFNPKLLRSGAFLISELHRIPYGAKVLDLGSGSGACGIAAALRGCQVVAVDINPSAVRCTRINALLNNVDIDIRQGDLFAPVTDERFNVILFNPPYYRGAPRDALDHAWRSTDIAERFAAQLMSHLAPSGYALVVLSSDGDAAFLHHFAQSGLRHDVVARRDLINEVMTIHEVRPAAAC
jgi:release factor glutamine methyltransferase